MLPVFRGVDHIVRHAVGADVGLSVLDLYGEGRLGVAEAGEVAGLRHDPRARARGQDLVLPDDRGAVRVDDPPARAGGAGVGDAENGDRTGSVSFTVKTFQSPEQ